MTGRTGVARPRLLQAVAAASVLYGGLLVAVPGAVTGAVGGAAPAGWIVRMLGARQVGQGAVLLLRPVASTAGASAVVDGLHAVTMVAAALRWPAHRRAATVSGAVAVTSGALAAFAAR